MAWAPAAPIRPALNATSPANSRATATGPPPAIAATTMTEIPTIDASQPIRYRPGAARPSRLNMRTPGRDEGWSPLMRSVDCSIGSAWRAGAARPGRSTLRQRIRRGPACTSAARLGAHQGGGRRSLDRGRPGGRGELCHRGGRDLTSLEVVAAPGAERPVQAHQAAAIRADPLESCPAGGTDDPFLVHAPSAGGTGVDGLHLGQESLLGQVSLVDLADLLVGSDDLVDEHGGREEDRCEDDDEARHEIGQDGVLGPQLHVAKRPVGGREPQDDPIDGDGLEAHADRRAVEQVADRISDLLDDLVHAPVRTPPVAGVSACGGLCDTPPWAGFRSAQCSRGSVLSRRGNWHLRYADVSPAAGLRSIPRRPRPPPVTRSPSPTSIVPTPRPVPNGPVV